MTHDPAQIARLIQLDRSETASGFDAPEQAARMAQHFEHMHDRADRHQRLRHIEWAILLLGGIAIGLLVGWMIGHGITGAAAAIADPLAGKPW